MVRMLIAAFIVCAAAGLVLLGRVTASGGVSAESVATREAGAYERGLSEGVAEGRELQATLSLRGASRQGVRAAYRDGYVAGQNDAFGGFDGGWRFGTTYVVSVARGHRGITYRIVSRAVAPAGCRPA